jgi:IMP dehydrogenase
MSSYKEFIVNITKSLSFGDVLLVPEYSDLMHKSDADITYTYSNFTSVPVINAPMLAVTSIPLLHYLSNIKGYPVSVHRYYNTVDDQINSLYSWGNEKTNWNRVFVSVGSVYKWQEWIDILIHFHVLQHPIAFLVDMAHGNTKTCVDTVKYIRNVLPKANIMAGNIATSDGMIRLVDAGANYIRCSIGGGYACSTRNNCAVGVPTFQALLDCVPHKKGAYLVADGGISEIGDVIKAIAIGADMVMIGKMFAATSLSGARKFNSSGVVIDNPELYTTDRLNVEYYGMASAKAQSVLGDGEKHSVEGVGGFIPYYGSTENFVESMEQNFRSSLAYYMGVTNWYELRNNGVRFVELSDHGRVESTIRM